MFKFERDFNKLSITDKATLFTSLVLWKSRSMLAAIWSMVDIWRPISLSLSITAPLEPSTLSLGITTTDTLKMECHVRQPHHYHNTDVINSVFLYDTLIPFTIFYSS